MRISDWSSDVCSSDLLLSYPRDTAGSLMTTEFVSVPATWTVEATLQHIREVERTRETVYAIYVLDPASQRLLRTASLRRLIASAPEASILSVSDRKSTRLNSSH